MLMFWPSFVPATAATRRRRAPGIDGTRISLSNVSVMSANVGDESHIVRAAP